MARIVDPTALPVPRTALLMDGGYHTVTIVTLPEAGPPESVRWQGRVFGIYHQTRALPLPEDANRQHFYREVEVWDAP